MYSVNTAEQFSTEFRQRRKWAAGLHDNILKKGNKNFSSRFDSDATITAACRPVLHRGASLFYLISIIMHILPGKLTAQIPSSPAKVNQGMKIRRMWWHLSSKSVGGSAAERSCWAANWWLVRGETAGGPDLLRDLQGLFQCATWRAGAPQLILHQGGPQWKCCHEEMTFLVSDYLTSTIKWGYCMILQFVNLYLEKKNKTI